MGEEVSRISIAESAAESEGCVTMLKEPAPDCKIVPRWSSKLAEWERLLWWKILTRL